MTVRPLSPLLAKKAKEELNETPERIEEDIKNLREWILKQPHLKTRLDDQHLVSFLRSSKWSLERAKRKVDTFYTLRSAMPSITSQRDPNDVKARALLKAGVAFFVPKCVPEDGPRIFIVRPAQVDLDKYTISDGVRLGSFLSDILFANDDNLIVSGVINIYDMSNVTMKHMLQMDAAFMKKMALYTSEGCPMRHKGTYMVNISGALETTFNLFKGLFGEKHKSRLHAFKSVDSVLEHVPKDALPKEYGGNNMTINEIIKYWEKQLDQHWDFLMEENNFTVDEKLRPADSKLSAKNLFGTEGSFRKLNVD